MGMSQGGLETSRESFGWDVKKSMFRKGSSSRSIMNFKKLTTKLQTGVKKIIFTTENKRINFLVDV